MNIERKQKLLKYLYPTEKIRSFLCNDLYMELHELIPRQLCISTQNMTLAVRKGNLNKLETIITSFLEGNKEHYQSIMQLCQNQSWDTIIQDIVIGYTFFTTNLISRYNGIDIFKDRRSVCYAPISIIDLL